MERELAMRLSHVTLYNLLCVPWVRWEDRRGMGEDEVEVEVTDEKEKQRGC